MLPNYNRLIPSGRPLFAILDNGYCSAAAKRLACWVSGSNVRHFLCSIKTACYSLTEYCHCKFGVPLQISIQRCDRDGDNRLRVCHSACQSYNAACGARLDCSDRTLFSGEGDGAGTCTGDGAVQPWWQVHFRILLLVGLLIATACFFLGAIRHICRTFCSSRTVKYLPGAYVLEEEVGAVGTWKMLQTILRHLAAVRWGQNYGPDVTEPMISGDAVDLVEEGSAGR